MELARPANEERTKTYADDDKYLHGFNHWPTPTSYRHYARDQWKAKPTANYLYQVYATKQAMVLGVPPAVHAEPIQTDVTTDELEVAKNFTKHEADRLGWKRLRRKIFFDGFVVGKGIAHVYSERDEFSQEMKLCVEKVDPRRFGFIGGDNLADAAAIYYEPPLNLSKIIEIFPDKGPMVKPNTSVPYGRLTATSTRSRSNDEIMYGPAGQTAITQEGKFVERKADVCFVWIKQPGIVEDVVKRDEVGNDVTETARKYPYGRLIAYSGEVLLYDGPSPYQIETVFPFAEYVHNDRPGDPWGFGDIALGKSGQMVADKNRAMLLDAQRLTSSGKFEAPIGADAYVNDSNAPGATYPVPPELMGMAHWIVPQGYNVQLHSVLDEMNHRDIQMTLGVTDVTAGLAPNAPTSGVEVEARQRAANTRIGQHNEQMAQFDSDLLNLILQMGRQLYVGPRTFTFKNQMSELQAITTDISLLPPGIAIKVSVDPEQAQKDKLQGQNTLGMITSGIMTNPMIVPFLHVLLPKLGYTPQESVELQQIAQGMMQMMPPIPPPGSEQNVGPSEAPGPPPA